MTNSWRRLQRHPLPQRSAVYLLLGFALSISQAAAETNSTERTSSPVPPELRTFLSSGRTVIGEPIRYPVGRAARVTAVEITLQPGAQTGWHTHPVPLFGYILEGELTVDYGAKGKRTYRKGDGLLEAMDHAHNGRNTGSQPVRILAVFIGEEGARDTAPASPPTH
jgi:quercetin dioxygenase-like cupin family protein